MVHTSVGISAAANREMAWHPVYSTGLSKEHHMVGREWTLALAFLWLPISAGCRGQFTDENVPEKIVTQDEMKELYESQKRIAELGVKGVNAPGTRRTQRAPDSGQENGR
jgi:hypothetical protein